MAKTQCVLAKAKYDEQYRLLNKEKIQKRMQQYYIDNREKILKTQKQYYTRELYLEGFFEWSFTY